MTKHPVHAQYSREGKARLTCLYCNNVLKTEDPLRLMKHLGDSCTKISTTLAQSWTTQYKAVEKKRLEAQEGKQKNNPIQVDGDDESQDIEDADRKYTQDQPVLCINKTKAHCWFPRNLDSSIHNSAKVCKT